MFGGAFRSLVRSNRERRTHTDVMTAWLVRARLGPVPTGQLGKRRTRRWSWRGKLWAQVGVDRYHVRTFDVSAGGAGLLMPQRLPDGTVIKIQDMPDGPVIEACVMHVDGPDKRGMFRTGVQFVVPNPDAGGNEG